MHRFGLLAALAVCAAPGVARADILTLYLHGKGGGGTGKGLGGDRVDDAFHAGAEGLTYGGKLGVEIVFLDLWVEHDQFVDGGGVDGTWTQLMTGIDLDLGIGPDRGGVRNDLGEVDGGHSAGYFELGTGVGLALGTGRQVDPPLDNSELTDKGVVAEARAGIGFRLTPSFGLGLTVPFKAAYLIKSGAGADAGDLGSHYTEVAVAALLILRLDLRLK